jgi:hypothetical protein
LVIGTLSGTIRSFPYSNIPVLKDRDCAAEHEAAANATVEEDEEDIEEILAYVQQPYAQRHSW